MSNTAEDFLASWRLFQADRPILIVTHNDADGLASGVLFKRAFDRLGRAAEVRILGRGESPYADAIQAEWRGRSIGGLLVADLGVRAGALGTSAPTVVIDHHVPSGRPDGATVLTGIDEDPIPTTSLLAYRCITALGVAEDLLWLAALGLMGDLGDKAPFAELAAAKTQYGSTALRDLVSLVNAPRRTGAGDAGPAFSLLMEASDPKEALRGAHPQRDALLAAREEVKVALEAGRRVPPKVVGDVALITLDSACQIHPLVAQSWRARLKDKVVIAANHGFRPGWVHFAARTATGRNLIEFLHEVAPLGADENYGSGHAQATGGALRLADWPVFLGRIGFGAKAS